MSGAGQFHQPQPRVIAITDGSAGVKVPLIEGPFYGLFMLGAFGNGFLCPLDVGDPTLFSAGELLDMGCIQWSTNRFVPVVWERLQVVNRALSTVNASGPPALLVYTSDRILPPPT